jgi:KUP system potassium uptake protein
MTWFGIVLPCVMLSYLGQGALIVSHPASVKKSNFNPFFQLIPHSVLLPMVVLATAATIIASQAAVTGSFSVAKQAVQLGFLPRLRIVHTSNLEGQIYVPVINWVLCLGVATLVLVFQNSNSLADIYGVAVTGTFVLNTILFIAVARSLWRTPKWKLGLLGALLLVVEVGFFSSNLTKIGHGAYLPLAVGVVVASIMVTWRRGREIVTRNRTQQEGSLAEFLDQLPNSSPRIMRSPGTAIFLNRGEETTPLALRAVVEHSHVLPEKVIIVSVDTVSVPRIEKSDRFSVKVMGHGLCKVVMVTMRCGYRNRQNVPQALADARKQGLLDRNLDLEHASYFLSHITIKPNDQPGMARPLKKLFVTMARNSASPIEAFGLPSERTVILGSQVAV